MHKVLLGCAVAALPVVAVAQCPTDADLVDGIYVTYNDGTYTKYSGEVDGQVDELTIYLDGSNDSYFVPTLSGLFATGYIDGPGGQLDERTRETVTYSTDLSNYLPVKPGLQFSVSATRTYADGTPEEDERYSVLVGQEHSISIGECSYTAFPITHTFIDSDGVSGLTQEYLPELGIGIYTGYTEMGNPPEVYAATEISAWAPN